MPAASRSSSRPAPARPRRDRSIRSLKSLHFARSAASGSTSTARTAPRRRSRTRRAARFAERLAREPDFEVAIPPQCNIVCFRHRPEGATDLDALQATLRRGLVEDGSFYLVQTRLPAGIFLRITIINPLTSDADLDVLVYRLREAARRR